MKLHTLNDLLILQLRDLLHAEEQLLKALPKLSKAATNPDLQAAFREHLAQTKMHVGRLEAAFDHLGHKARRTTCKGMKGLIAESHEYLRKRGSDADVRDAGLIAAAQRIEHYEIAAYGCVAEFANKLGLGEVGELLHATLEEERQADAKLTDIAQRRVNPAAGHEEAKPSRPNARRTPARRRAAAGARA